MKDFLAEHRSQEWLAEQVKCTPTHLRRFINQGKAPSAELLDRITEVLDREEKRTAPLTDSEIQDVRLLLVHFSDELVSLRGDAHVSGELLGQPAPEHRLKLREVDRKEAKQSSPRDQRSPHPERHSSGESDMKDHKRKAPEQTT